ncbi:MAG: glycosyltransferase [Planctomycetota bacterium]
MNIAIIVTQFPVVASEMSVLNQITGLIDSGHQVDIYAERRGDTGGSHRQFRDYDLDARTTYRTLPTNKISRVVKGIVIAATWIWKRPKAIVQSLNFLRYGVAATSLSLLYAVPTIADDSRYDVIHCQFGPNGIKGLFFRESGLMTGKLITQFRGSDLNVYPMTHGRGVYRRLFRRGDMFLALSDFLVAKARELGCPADKLNKLPLGIEMAEFPFCERGLAPDSPVRLLTVARLVEVKGIEYAIRGVARVINQFPNVRYQIAGTGPLLGELQNLVRTLEIQDHVEFLGLLTRERLREVYAESHLFLLTGVVADDGGEEGLGTVLAEAQATGLPVLASRVGGIPECVVEGESAILIPERDLDAIAEQLARLIEHPDQWPIMGRAGREHVLTHFQNNDKVGTLLAYYEKALSPV